MDTTLDFFMIEAEILNALAHPSRLEILELLRDGEHCVCHLQAVLDQRQAYISQQLNTLRHAGLVTHRKDGKRVYYQASDPQIFKVLDSLQAFLQAQNRQPVSTPAEALPASPRNTCSCPECASSPA